MLGYERHNEIPICARTSLEELRARPTGIGKFAENPNCAEALETFVDAVFRHGAFELISNFSCLDHVRTKLDDPDRDWQYELIAVQGLRFRRDGVRAIHVPSNDTRFTSYVFRKMFGS